MSYFLLTCRALKTLKGPSWSQHSFYVQDFLQKKINVGANIPESKISDFRKVCLSHAVK